jgi:hypothetical protein
MHSKGIMGREKKKKNITDLVFKIIVSKCIISMETGVGVV